MRFNINDFKTSYNKIEYIQNCSQKTIMWDLVSNCKYLSNEFILTYHRHLDSFSLNLTLNQVTALITSHYNYLKNEKNHKYQLDKDDDFYRGILITKKLKQESIKELFHILQNNYMRGLIFQTQIFTKQTIEYFLSQCVYLIGTVDKAIIHLISCYQYIPEETVIKYFDILSIYAFQLLQNPKVKISEELQEKLNEAADFQFFIDSL